MKIYKLFSSYRRWTKSAYARLRYVSVNNPGALSHSGNLNAKDPQAHCWCLFGAIQKCYPAIDQSSMHEQDRVTRRVSASIRKSFPKRDGSITVFNDAPNTTFADVLAVVKHAKV
jgi:hypothetical protein